MPQMDLVKFNNPSNVDLLNYIRGNIVGSDYQSRVPAATRANIDDAINSMWDYQPTRNQFIDSLMNLIGLQILKYSTYTNPWAKFKRGMMTYGESIEEVAVGLLKAKAYNPDAEYLERTLFGRETNEVQSRWHRINRQDFYKLTLNESMLRRAFLNPNGLSEFMTAEMSTISTSDNFDEFEIMLNLLNQYYDEGGFFEVNVPDISKITATSNDAKQFLKVARAWAAKLPLKPSRLYNAAKMPIVTTPDQLELFLTPTGQANLDVEGLAALFNADLAAITSRITLIPEDDIRIPGFQGIMTTREFFIVADTYMAMTQQQNVAGRYTNFFHHHDEIISASPFVPAILFTSTGGTAINVITYVVNGISGITITDLDTQAVVADSNVTRGKGYLVAGTALTTPAGGPNDALTLSVLGRSSTRTRITEYGVLVIGSDEQSDTLTIRALATDDNSFVKDTVVNVVGSLVYGTVGGAVDDNVPVIQNRKKPSIAPNGGPVGTTFTADPGDWDTRGLTFGYQWQAGGSNVAASGTSSTYAAVAADAGKALTVIVTATKAGKTTGTATSNGVNVTAS